MIEATDTDTKTADLPGVEPLPVPKKRGRKRLYANEAEKQAAFRARHNVKPLTVMLPADLRAEFEAWIAAKGKNKADVIAHLIRTQLLRKR